MLTHSLSTRAEWFQWQGLECCPDTEETHGAHQILGMWGSQIHLLLRRKASTSSLKTMLLQSQAVC